MRFGAPGGTMTYSVVLPVTSSSMENEDVAVFFLICGSERNFVAVLRFEITPL